MAGLAGAAGRATADAPAEPPAPAAPAAPPPAAPMPAPPAGAASTAAGDAGPLRLALECQGTGRTRACPAYLRGFVDHDPLFLVSPRSAAQVTLYVNVTEVAATDRVQLRFVGSLPGAPRELEVVVDLDTNGPADAQVAALYRGFTRGVALYVAALHPEAVEVTLAKVAAAAVAAPATTPWSFAVSLGGYGSWTRRYQSMSGWGSVEVSRVERRSQLSAAVGVSYGASRQPPLVTDDGQEISLDTDQYGVEGGGGGVLLLDERWSVGLGGEVQHEDPQGQYDLRVEALAGVEWDRYAADDPRGNRLAVAYRLGVQHDRYNFANELGERVATYPLHSLAAVASVREDRLEYGLRLLARAELLEPARRYTLSASPYVTLQLGAHVDVSLSLSATARELPAPVIDPSDFEQLTRASYAEPLSTSGSVYLRVHWDRTNGQRNDRFSGLDG